MKAAWPGLRVCAWACFTGGLHTGTAHVSRALDRPLLPLNWLPWAWPALRRAEGHSGKGCHA